jgi:Spy/CpxP family protein refolding chaperone
MRPSFVGRCLAALLATVALSAPVGAQSFAWWKSEQFQKDVGLTTEQCARIDAIFQATLPKLKQNREDLDKLEAELSKMIGDGADERLVVRQIDRVEALRSATSKMRTLMLLHERQVLTPEQLVKFKAAYEQWEKDHHRPPRVEPTAQASVKK